MPGVMSDTPTAAPAPAPNVALLLHLVARHAKLQRMLSYAKDYEMRLRKKIVDLSFDASTRGTKKLDLPQHAFSLKAVVKQSIKADEAGLQDIIDGIPNNAGLLKWKPEMSLSKFEALDQVHKDALAGNVTIKEDSPQLEYDGDLPTFSNFDTMKMHEGLIVWNDQVLDQATADKVAQDMGLAGALELVALLQEIS